MYKGKRVIAIVPARGGSKGIPLKNLITFKDKSLIQRVSEVIKEIKEIDTAIVSTDNKDIAEEAQRFGLQVPFFRPCHLSGDLIGDVDVLIHALLESEKKYQLKYDIVMMLQPTSPNRTSKDIYAALDKMIIGEFDSLWTISKIDKKFHPLKQLSIKNNLISYYDTNGAEIIARQQLSDLYYRNGIAYLINRAILIEEKSIMGQKCGALLIDRYVSNIDNLEDIKLGELLS
ncbi:MAG: CMP-N-acetylneuraminic acid synthetase [Candidatus Marinimicrobia bacterium]|nr:CMP-N-acetylneuraminic acid synthetase [Candidatus Neomarinimicrobiota bacterium]|tara:strand:- start:3561 stop:4253 length:693 start_codon:yes stop_codon:yes gene_type:complete